MVAGASSLVRRARMGDQNAMGMLQTIAHDAEQGSAKARESLALIKSYIQANPPKVDESVSFGEEMVAKKATSVLVKRQDAPPFVAIFFLSVGGDKAIMGGAIILANGPPLTNERIRDIVCSIENPEIRKCVYTAIAFFNRVAGAKLPGNALPYARAGECIGLARGLQKVRQPGAKVSKFDPMVGWELGE